MLNLFTQAEMYPWMAEFKKGDGSFHHDHGYDIGMDIDSFRSTR